MTATFSDLPKGVVDNIVYACSNDAKTLASFAACNAATHESAKRALQEMRDKWNTLLATAPTPFKKCTPELNAQDDELLRFVASDALSIEYSSRTRTQRKWFHLRAKSLGLKTETIRRKGPMMGTVRVFKTPNWALPDKLMPAVGKFPGRRTTEHEWTTIAPSAEPN